MVRQRERIGQRAAERGDARTRGAHDMNAAGFHRFAKPSSPNQRPTID